MASRRKKRKQQDIDPLGGFSLEQLLGLDPVVALENKQSIIGRILGAPFKVLGALLMLPFRLLAMLIKVPVRAIKAILPPYGNRKN